MTEALCSFFQFQTFLTQINSSLVDSNMLVRCIVLSLDRFESQTDDVKGMPTIHAILWYALSCLCNVCFVDDV